MPAVNYYIALPVTLYRMTLGGKVRVRKHTAEAGLKYDIVAEGPDETVKPKWQDLVKYQGMRPFPLETPGGQDYSINTFGPNSAEWSLYAAYDPRSKRFDRDIQWDKRPGRLYP